MEARCSTRSALDPGPMKVVTGKTGEILMGSMD